MWSIIRLTGWSKMRYITIMIPRVWSADITLCGHPGSTVSGLGKQHRIFNLQRLPNCTPLSIIQCYSCEECPNKTMLQQWINCAQDAEYVMTCPQKIMLEFHRHLSKHQSKTGITNLSNILAWYKHTNDLLPLSFEQTGSIWQDET